MKITFGLVAALLMAAQTVSFFKYQRSVETANSNGQRFAVADEALWRHGKPGLADLRLYSADREIPYVLEIEKGGLETEQRECRVLQPAAVAGGTQFLLDMSGVPEYDRVTLKLTTTDFVAHAQVSGQDDPHGTNWAVLGTTTLYDLSEEKLGRNHTLQIPVSTYKYLRVIIDRLVKPADVKGGVAGITREQKAIWRTIGSGPKQSHEGKDTVLTFSVPENVPVERLVIELDSAQGNFRREVVVQGDQGQGMGTGEISRVHMNRGGAKIDAEHTTVGIFGTHYGTLKAIIHNGDDLSLKITGARLEQYERRIYFDSTAETPQKLYYGDDKLTAPVYDYAGLFQKDAAASQIQLGAEEVNAAYTGRPDGRAWSERHPAVLWLAIIAAVLILGGFALKSMRTASA